MVILDRRRRKRKKKSIHWNLRERGVVELVFGTRLVVPTSLVFASFVGGGGHQKLVVPLVYEGVLMFGSDAT